MGQVLIFACTLALPWLSQGPAPRAGLPDVEAFLVAGLPGEAPADRQVSALRGEPVSIFVVVRVGRGPRALFFSDASEFVRHGRRQKGGSVRPLSPLGRTISWWRVEPHQHHLKTPPPNKGNQAYSNAVLFGPRHGKWLGFDTIEYHESRIDGAQGPRLVVDRSLPTHPKLKVHRGLGTLRYKATVEWEGTTLTTPGAGATSAQGIRSEVLRVSFRDGDDFVGHLTSYYNVPNVFGSAGPGILHQTEQFQGADCADVLVGAARRGGARMAYSNVEGLRREARVVSPRLLLGKSGVTFADGPRKGQRAELRFGSDLQRGDLMLIDYVGWDGSNRTWDHVAVLSKDAGTPGVFDPEDLVMHMGYLYGLVEASAGADGEAVVQFLRFSSRHQAAFRWTERRLARERARRQARAAPAGGAKSPPGSDP
ncbi:MAG: hypothetical protein RBU30_24460 [Polyangia bacterium]|jgi:hypothetical protein|nr:hypothetical protein [Polyangia bacterium]